MSGNLFLDSAFFLLNKPAHAQFIFALSKGIFFFLHCHAYTFHNDKESLTLEPFGQECPPTDRM